MFIYNMTCSVDVITVISINLNICDVCVDIDCIIHLIIGKNRSAVNHMILRLNELNVTLYFIAYSTP
jgi:hypothetical protein